MEEDTEYLNLPIEQRCLHKLWKARVNGYEAATKLFKQISDDKSPEWSKYLGLIKKCVVDSNAVAQEKGLDAVLSYVENAGCAGKTCGEVVSGIVSKCLGAPKSKTKEKGIEIILMYIEIERTDIVLDELIKGLSNKTPKVVVACIQALRQALFEFGSKVITLKQIVRQIPVLLEDRDKNVREESKLLTVEVYRWIGDALKPQLSSLKQVQVTELEIEFEKVATGKASPIRFLRSQQELRAKLVQHDVDDDVGEGDENEYEDAAKQIDPFEYLQPVDILSKLPNDFYEKCEAKKWQDRKEAVDFLLPHASSPKLENGDYGDLVRALKKIISKDTNVMVIAVAGKCLAGLALGLKKRFHPYVGQCVSAVLDKFKEKKQNVVVAMREAMDAIFLCTTLDALSEVLLTFLDNKNPSVKTETSAFMTRSFAVCDAATLNKKLLKTFCPSLLKALNDHDPAVRDSAAEVLGTAMKVVGENVIMPFIQEVDSLKMNKIKECYEKCVVVKPKTLLKAKASRMQATTSVPASGSGAVTDPVTKASSAPVKKSPLAAVPKPGVRNVSKPRKCASAPSASNRMDETRERELTAEEVDEMVAEILSLEITNGLVDLNWKTRLSAMEQFIQVVRPMSRCDIPTQALVKVLIKKPGLKDTNFQVLKLKLELVTYLASNSNFSRRCVDLVVDDLSEKISDAKNGTAVTEALTAIAEANQLDYLSNQVLHLVFLQKNPKNQCEAMNWLAKAIKEFGLVVHVKPIIDNVKKALAATNPAVRSSAITLLGVMYLYMGPNLRMLFENEKTSLLQQMDAEFEKFKGVVPPTPIRGVVHAKSDVNSRYEDNEGGKTENTGYPNITDLVPRTDISGQLSGSLLDEMADKNWKVRLEALQKLATIISEVKFITSNLGDLPTVLKARLTDSNKNLAVQAINICQAIGSGMGPDCSKYVRILSPGMIAGLGDGKNTVRTAAVTCLNAWIEQCGLAPFIDGEQLSESLKVENPNLRAELFGWLSEHLPNAKSVSVVELSLCVPHLFAALEDRNVDVRKKAQEAILPFMIHLGYDQMVRAACKLKPASKTHVQSYLDKAKPNLPVKVTLSAKTVRGGAKPAAHKASSPSAVVDSVDTYNDFVNGLGSGGAESGPLSNKPGNKSKTTKVVSKVKQAVPSSRSTSGKRAGDDVDTSPSIIANNLKENRMLDEHRLKVLKWNFTAPRDEFYELLKDQMTIAGFNRCLLANLFHNDFKFHIRALDTFQECLENAQEATIANLDLILKWLALRFFDTNPSVIIKGLEYLQGLFALLAANAYNLYEYEGSSFIPYLILKVGDPKDAVRQSVRSIFKLMYKVFPANRMFTYLMDGLKSKNARQRTECLEELSCLIDLYGMSVCQPNPSAALREVARQISDRDNSVRNAALNCVVQAYFLDGERVYKHIGPISDKDLGLLEERIKRASKNRSVQPVSGQQPLKAQSPESKVKVPSPRPVSQIVTEEQAAIVRRMAVPAKPVISRPLSGAYSLDLEKLEQSMEEVVIPFLVKPDLDDLGEPVRLPETKMRPPSPATKILNNSHDAASAMDLVISQIASNDVMTSVQALAQIDEFLKVEERAETMMSRVDQLLVASSLQYRMIYTKHMSDESTDKADVIRLYRCLSMTAVSLFKHRSLAKKVSKDVLRDFVCNLLTVLMDSRLSSLEDGPNIIRAINVIVVKVVEHADHTKMMSALIKLLHDCVANDNSSAKFTELIMKCIWKMVRLLPDIAHDLNLDKILLDLHQFLKTFPSSHWKKKQSDMPLRTVKTLLHTLAKQKGNKIMSHLTLIDNVQDSEIETYLQKVLKGGVRLKTSGNDESTDHLSLARKDSRHSPRRLSKTTHDTLAEIFKKIGCKETTREGLLDLHSFKEQHPEADIEPYLKKSSQFFQNYIERGLLNIKLERDGGKVTTSTGQLQKQNQLSNSTGSIPAVGAMVATSIPADAEMPPDVYRERLKLLRAQCGLDNLKFEVAELTSTTLSHGTLSKAVSMSESLEYSRSRTSDARVGRQEEQLEEGGMASHITHSSSSEGLSSIATSIDDGAVEDLKRRLERIKNSTRI